MLSSGLYDIDDKKDCTTLFIIDPQIDFHTGSLKVPGAVDDAGRIAQMIIDNVQGIDNIIISMDSHHRNHIAHAVFWKQGEKFDLEEFRKANVHLPNPQPQKKRRDPSVFEPPPFALIPNDHLERKIWTPVDQSLVVSIVGQTLMTV